ncbi:unnamed protein product [Aphis gossypii]|uniref:Uncharacterized protein n=1 Tax=Aphis gossypii TaxID=80765 RepID=A0A9P0J2L8_APHGO|nr:unnamed protein product [Aphis gossypii]
MDAIVANIVNEPSSDDAATADQTIIETIDYIITSIEEDEKSETAEVQRVIDDVMDQLLTSVCESPSLAASDASDDDSPVEVIGEELSCGGGDIVAQTTSPAAKGPEVRNSLGRPRRMVGRSGRNTNARRTRSPATTKKTPTSVAELPARVPGIVLLRPTRRIASTGSNTRPVPFG